MDTTLAFGLTSLAAAQDLRQVAWIAGCWEGSMGGRVVQEQWMKPSGGTMLGMSRTIAGGKTVSTEFLQLREEQGTVVYTALPGLAAKATPFKLVRSSATGVVFENPEHDFPQRILYRKQPDGGLLARIEGTEKGKERGVDFPMKRVACE